MINADDVSNTLKTIGSLSDDELIRARPFCEITCAEIFERLKDKSDETNAAVISVCAAVTLYRYVLSAGLCSEEFSSFKAGDVTISRSAAANAENAVRLRDEALSAAARFLTDVDFVFEAVEI